jgi:hypothetical protein
MTGPALRARRASIASRATVSAISWSTPLGAVSRNHTALRIKREASLQFDNLPRSKCMRGTGSNAAADDYVGAGWADLDPDISIYRKPDISTLSLTRTVEPR